MVLSFCLIPQRCRRSFHPLLLPREHFRRRVRPHAHAIARERDNP